MSEPFDLTPDDLNKQAELFQEFKGHPAYPLIIKKAEKKSPHAPNFMGSNFCFQKRAQASGCENCDGRTFCNTIAVIMLRVITRALETGKDPEEILRDERDENE